MKRSNVSCSISHVSYLNLPNLNSSIRGVVGQLLSVLNTRNRDVMSRRYGLKDGAKETLESIGRSYKITRERVRQIEESSIKQLRQFLASGASAKIKPFVDLAENILDQTNGVAGEDDLFEKFSGSARKNYANASLVFFLNIDNRFRKYPETDDLRAFWALSAQHADLLKKALALFTDALVKNAGPIAETAVVNFFKQTSALTKDVSAATVWSYLRIAKNIAKNNFGQIGLISWPDIKPRGVKDKAYLVLKKYGKPQHFRKITDLINTSGFDGGPANVQTVHNELIKDSRFVLVGRGLYGLSEWGLKAGTVKDVVVDLLRSGAKPMHKDDIVAGVLSHRLVKVNTILLSLQDSKVFKKHENGLYSLREA